MYRIGQSKDIHRLAEGRKLVIGTVEIPFEKGSVAHSDGDALVHAIVEAIIGAMGKGDIGKLYPDTDSKYKDISSSYFLTNVKSLLEQNNYEICNIDSTVVIEKPMLAKIIPEMKKNISNYLQISEDKINIKATRGEGLGYVGASEGYEAYAIVLLKNKNNLKKL